MTGKLIVRRAIFSLAPTLLPGSFHFAHLTIPPPCRATHESTLGRNPVVSCCRRTHVLRHVNRAASNSARETSVSDTPNLSALHLGLFSRYTRGHVPFIYRVSNFPEPGDILFSRKNYRFSANGKTRKEDTVAKLRRRCVDCAKARAR